MSETLQSLIDKLERARFTGELAVRFYQGEPKDARLTHCLATAEFAQPLPIVEPENASVPTCQRVGCKHSACAAKSAEIKAYP
jgi:hypothetical protein